MHHILKKVLKQFVKVTPLLSLRLRLLRLAGYKIGIGAYIPSDIVISDLKTRTNNLIIGDRVSIGPRVILITDSSPNNSKLILQFPLISGNIIIEEDVWLGAGVIVLPNVKIGKCAIVGAGSVCIKDIEPYTIVGGVPAKLIRKINKDEI